MVPGSTFRYGSNFIIVTRSPRSTRRRPRDAAAIPLPSEETTPPVTKMYLAIGMGLPALVCCDMKLRPVPSVHARVPPRVGAQQVLLRVDPELRRLVDRRHAHRDARGE